MWKYSSIVKVKELDEYAARVLHISCSPDAESVVSTAADETL